jgi:hypothetical protein
MVVFCGNKEFGPTDTEGIGPVQPPVRGGLGLGIMMRKKVVWNDFAEGRHRNTLGGMTLNHGPEVSSKIKAKNRIGRVFPELTPRKIYPRKTADEKTLRRGVKGQAAIGPIDFVGIFGGGAGIEEMECWTLRTGKDGTIGS